MNRFNFLHSLTALYFASCALFGCAKDRSLDDWKREKLEQELATIETQAGTYEGTLVAQDSESLLGPVQMTLRAQTKEAPGSSSYRADEQAIVTGTLTFGDDEPVTFKIKDGSYDRNRKSLRAFFVIDRHGADQSVQFNIWGSLDDGKFEGTLEAAGYPITGVLKLSRNQRLSARLQQDVVPRNSIISVYEGLGVMTNGAPDERVRLTIMSNRGSLEEEFLSRFTPVETVQATFSIGQDFEPAFREAHWDPRNGSLVARQQFSEVGWNEYTLAINCSRTHLAGGRRGLSCRYVSNRRGLVLTAQLEPVAIPN